MNEIIKDIFYDKRNNVRNGLKISQHRFAVWLPSNKQDTTPIDKVRHLAYKDGVMRFLITELGGATNYNAEGYYSDDAKIIHREDVIVCESYVEIKMLKTQATLFRALCNLLCMELDQKSIAGVVDGEMIFFAPTLAYRTNPHKTWHPDTKNIIRIRDSYIIPALKKSKLSLDSKYLINF